MSGDEPLRLLFYPVDCFHSSETRSAFNRGPRTPLFLLAAQPGPSLHGSCAFILTGCAASSVVGFDFSGGIFPLGVCVQK